jgi:hypothetical protein
MEKSITLNLTMDLIDQHNEKVQAIYSKMDG